MVTYPNAASHPPPRRHQTPRIVRPRVLAALGRMASLVANPPTNQRPGRGVPPRHLRGDRQGRGAGPERNLPTPRGKTPTAPEAGQEAPRQAAGNIRAATAADRGGAPKSQAPAHRARPGAGGASRRRRGRGAARTAAAKHPATPSSRRQAAAPARHPKATSSKSPIQAGASARPFRYDIERKSGASRGSVMPPRSKPAFDRSSSRVCGWATRPEASASAVVCSTSTPCCMTAEPVAQMRDHREVMADHQQVSPCSRRSRPAGSGFPPAPTRRARWSARPAAGRAAAAISARAIATRCRCPPDSWCG